MFSKQFPRAAGYPVTGFGCAHIANKFAIQAARLWGGTPRAALDIDGAAYARPRRNSKIRRHDFTPQTIRRNIALGESPLAAAA